jgi:hypothetical protein
VRYLPEGLVLCPVTCIELAPDVLIEALAQLSRLNYAKYQAFLDRRTGDPIEVKQINDSWARGAPAVWTFLGSSVTKGKNILTPRGRGGGARWAPESKPGRLTYSALFAVPSATEPQSLLDLSFHLRLSADAL